MLQEVQASELKALLAEKPDLQLVDVREQWEYDTVHIEGSILMPLSQFQNHYSKLDPSKPVVTYCHHGVRSMNAGMFLIEQGFEDVASLVGGIDAYSIEVDPSLARY